MSGRVSRVSTATRVLPPLRTSSEGSAGLGDDPPVLSSAASSLHSHPTHTSHISRLIGQYESAAALASPIGQGQQQQHRGSASSTGKSPAGVTRRVSALQTRSPSASPLPSFSPLPPPLPTLTLDPSALSPRSDHSPSPPPPPPLPALLSPPPSASPGAVPLPSPRTPGGSRARSGTVDDSGVDAAGYHYLARRSPMKAAPPLLSSSSSAQTPSSSSSGTTPSVASVRHKLQSFRTLPIMLLPHSTLTNGTTSNHSDEAKTHGDETKSGGSANKSTSPPPLPGHGSSASVGTSGGLNPSATSSRLSRSSPAPLFPGGSPAINTTSPPPSSSATQSDALSPTHFSYWEKRNIWVQREQEEMRAKANLKKVLRRINDSNLIVRHGRWGANASAASASASASAAASGAATSNGTATANGVQPSSAKSEGDVKSPPIGKLVGAAAASTIPSPPSVLRSASLPPPLPSSATATNTSVAPSSASQAPTGGVALPSPGFPPVTIGELSAAASTLNLTGALVSSSFMRDCAAHLNKMESASCRFNSAPQLMWALKALTLTGEEAAAANARRDARERDAQQQQQQAAPKSPGAIQAAQLTSAELFRQKKAAIEAIIAEQQFSPPVVHYIRSHALAPSSSVVRDSSQPSHSKAFLSEPHVLRATIEGAASPPTQPASFSTSPPPLPTFIPRRSFLSSSHPPNSATLVAISAPSAPSASNSASSTRSNSVQPNELELEWLRRHIPKVRLRDVKTRVREKIAEDRDDIEERRRALVDKLSKLRIWTADGLASLTQPAVLDALSAHRFDLLRFNFELTELAEMEGRNIRFASLPQALTTLRLLYEPQPAETLQRLVTEQAIPAHVQSYVEARRREIAASREEALGNRRGRRQLSLQLPRGAAGRGGGDGALSPSASPLRHHRSISLVELSEVLTTGNLLSEEAQQQLKDEAAAPPPLSGPTSPSSAGASSSASPQALSWLLSEVGLDVAEISIDDLIQMSQHPNLQRAFANPRQVVRALETLYTEHTEAEIESIAREEGMQPRVVEYLLAAHAGIAASRGDRARTLLARSKRKAELRNKIVQFELAAFEEQEEAEAMIEFGGSGPPVSPKTISPRVQLDRAERALLVSRDRSLHPLPALSLSQLTGALNGHSARSLLRPLSVPTPTPLEVDLSNADAEQLVVELALSLGTDGECEIDLEDAELMESKGLQGQFATHKQIVAAMQLLNVDCSIDEFDASCERAGFSQPVRAFLQSHARAPLAHKVLRGAAARHSSAAQYALLEAEVVGLDWSEMEGLDPSVDEHPVEWGTHSSAAALAARSSILLLSNPMIAEEDELGAGEMREEVVYASRESVARHIVQFELLDCPTAVLETDVSAALAESDAAAQLERLPAHCVERDLAALKQHGVRFPSAQHAVTVLDFLHRPDLDLDDREELEEVFSAASPAAKARHVEFLLDYRRSTHVDELEGAKLRVQRPTRRSVRATAASPMHLMQHDEPEMQVELVDEAQALAEMQRRQRAKAAMHKAHVQQLSLHQLEMELEELCIDSDGAVHASSGDSTSAANNRRNLRAQVAAMELDLSRVTLDEVRVVASRRRALPDAKTAVQVLKLMQLDFAGGISRDMLRAELQRMESAAGVASDPAAIERTVTLTLALEEELGGVSEEVSSEEVVMHRASESHASPPPPPPLPGTVTGAEVATATATTSDLDSPGSPEESPPPPPFPHHLLSRSMDSAASGSHFSASALGDVARFLSPPVPAFPFGRLGVRSDSTSSESVPPPPPPIPASSPQRSAVGSSSTRTHHVRFHSHEDLLTPEREYEALVEHIVERGLAKSPYSSVADLPMPLEHLRFGELTKKVDEVYELKRKRGVRGAVYDTPAHCIRCIYADVLPLALSQATGGSSSSLPPLSPQSCVTASPHPPGHLHAPSMSSSIPPPPLPSTSHSSRSPAPPNVPVVDTSLIASHIRSSSHFRPTRQQQEAQDKQKELTPIQETEPPPPAGCCGRAACVIQ